MSIMPAQNDKKRKGAPGASHAHNQAGGKSPRTGGKGASPGAARDGKVKKTSGKAYSKPAGQSGRPQSAAAGPSRPPHDGDGGLGSGNSSRRDQKEAVMARKASKKNFATIQECVALWEKLRPKQATDADRAKLVTEIIKKAQGKIAELASHHTASRVIQMCARYGGPEERAAIVAEVKASIVDMSKSKYGRHLVKKLIAVAPKEDVPGLVKLFKGHVAELLRQPYGADVLVDLYDVASTAQRNAMCSEFYGREFTLFDGVSGQAGALASLSQLLATVGPAKRRTIVQHITKALSPVMEKAILHPPITHRLLRDFLECAPSMSVEDAVDTLSATGTKVLSMVHTHEGAAVGCMLLAYGTAKDRKRLVKAMKGLVHDMAVNEWSHAVLCTALSVVDDTSIMLKSIIAELKAMVAEAVEDRYASRVLLQLLSPSSRRYHTQAVQQLLHPPTRFLKGSTGTMVTSLEGEGEEDVPFGDDAPAASAAGKRKRPAAGDDDEDEGAAGDAVDPMAERQLGASKKDPIARRRELLAGSGNSSNQGLGEAIARDVARRLPTLLRSAAAKDVVVEVARGGDDGLLGELCADAVAAVHTALAEAVARSPDEADSLEADEVGPAPHPEHVMTHYFASRALKRLLLSSAEEGPSGQLATTAAEQMWNTGLAGRCKQWLGTSADKVLAALLKCGSPSVRTAAAAELQSLLTEPLAEWEARVGGAPPEEGATRPRPAKVQKHAKAAAATGQSPAQPGSAAVPAKGPARGAIQEAAEAAADPAVSAKKALRAAGLARSAAAEAFPAAAKQHAAQLKKLAAASAAVQQQPATGGAGAAMQKGRSGAAKGVKTNTGPRSYAGIHRKA